jgi:hypothetical protein
MPQDTRLSNYRHTEPPQESGLHFKKHSVNQNHVTRCTKKDAEKRILFHYLSNNDNSNRKQLRKSKRESGQINVSQTVNH